MTHAIGVFATNVNKGVHDIVADKGRLATLVSKVAIGTLVLGTVYAFATGLAVTFTVKVVAGLVFSLALYTLVRQRSKEEKSDAPVQRVVVEETKANNELKKVVKEAKANNDLKKVSFEDSQPAPKKRRHHKRKHHNTSANVSTP